YLLAVLLVIPVYKISKAGDRNFEELEVIFSDVLTANTEPAIVFTDGLLSYGYHYFYDLESSNLSFIWFSERYGVAPMAGDYLLVNPAYLNKRYNDFENLDLLKEQVEALGLRLEPISRGEVEFYRIVE
ncbi:MAG: hypothetical protein HWE07_11965, partial [Cytophagia bacterium]|nr:hypothetical protein [Cytophagia bacterium]